MVATIPDCANLTELALKRRLGLDEVFRLMYMKKILFGLALEDLDSVHLFAYIPATYLFSFIEVVTGTGTTRSIEIPSAKSFSFDYQINH